MNFAAAYALYYDLLYQDKDYASETEFVLKRIQSFCSPGSLFLEIGCGTGLHAEHLARAGFRVIGVDRSMEMLQKAEARRLFLPEAISKNLTFAQQDATNLRFLGKFQAAISLFHVASYLTETEEIMKMFAGVSAHLEPGGVFFFDCWYGPAVLSERPAVRVKRWRQDPLTVLRVAEPILDINKNRVDVHYDVITEDELTRRTERFSEVHHMRYFFLPEIEYLLKVSGLSLIRTTSWLSDEEPNDRNWYACFLARK